MGGAATRLIHEEAKKYTALDEGLEDRNRAIEEVKRLRKALHQYYGNLVGDAAVSNEINRREPFHAAEILHMGEEELSIHKKKVREAAEKREKKRKRDMNKAMKANDYSKSFSGTAADTSKEKEFADLTNTSGAKEISEENPYLAPVGGSESELQKLRENPLGWCKLMGANDCIIYLNCFTHEITGLRPEGFVNETSQGAENESTVQTVEDLAMGLQIVESDDLLDNIENAIENRKTTLVLDTSADDVLKTYFTYKGVLCDLSDLAKPLGQQRREGIVSISILLLLANIKSLSTNIYILNNFCRRPKKCCKPLVQK